MKPKNYAKGGSLKPVPPAKKGLAKLPAEVRNKMGYMKGGGKLGMKPNTTYSTSKKYLTDEDFKGAEWLGTTRAEFEDASNKGKLKNIDPKTGKVYGKKTLMTKPLPSKGFTMSPKKNMAGGGKLDMMYKNGGKAPIDPDPKRKLSPMAQKLERAQAAQTEKTFMANARAQEARNLTEMRNALKAEGPAAVAKLDKEIKAKGFKVVQRPVKKMAQGGKLKPMHPTKDNNSFISNAVDMSPSTKKQMQALRQAMMYFTGVSPKNK